MSIDPIAEYSGAPPLPSQSDVVFNANMGAMMTHIAGLGGNLNTFAGQANSLAQQVDAGAASAGDSAALAIAIANFKGDWGALTGSCAIPASVYHDSKFWILRSNIADITAKAPGVATEWAESTINVGGGAAVVNTGVDVTLSSARVQSVTTTVPGVNVTLPAVAWAEGGPSYVIYNAGYQDFFVYSSAGVLIGKITSKTGVMLFVAGGVLLSVAITVGQGNTIIPGVASVFESASTLHISVAPISTNKLLVCYQDAGNSNYGTAVVLSVSGTVITPGAPVVFESANTTDISVTQIGTDKALVCYADNGNGTYGTAIVLSVSGTVITPGAPVVFAALGVDFVSVTQMSTDKALVCYQGSAAYGTAIVLSVSGTVITPGSPVVFENAYTSEISVTLIATNKALVCYSDNGNSGYGTAIVLSVSGTVITPGAPVVYLQSSTAYHSAIAVSSDRAIVACSTSGAAIVLSVSGTVITPSAPFSFMTNGTWISLAKFADGKSVACYRNYGNSYYGTAITLFLGEI